MKDFDRWVLVAPPEILSDFRLHLDPVLKHIGGQTGEGPNEDPERQDFRPLAWRFAYLIFTNSIEYFPSLWAASSIA